MPIRAVVFDLFDTLVDVHMESLPRVRVRGEERPGTGGVLFEALGPRPGLTLESFLEALAAVDRGLRETRYAEGREVPTRERFAALAERLGLAEPDLPERLTRLHMAKIREQVTVPGHHAALLERLGKRGLELGLCSNFTHSETALAILEEAGMAAHLRATAVSDAVGWRKPRREIFEAALAALGCAPEETLHVGDNLHADVAGAAALGCHTAWVTRRVPDPEARLAAHRGAPPDLVVSDLAELEARLERIPEPAG